MGKKHKHPEHQNMEAWVISYADMVTLLFALFVVLYAIGETKLRKLKKLKKSVAFAFSFDGLGGTDEPGLHDREPRKKGEVIKAAQILNAQNGSMKKYVSETLPKQFTETTGHSLKIVQTDDTIAFEAPVSAYFNRGESSPLRSSELTRVLNELVDATAGFTDTARVRIDSPNVVIGQDPRSRVLIRSGRLCLDRLYFLSQFLSTSRNIDPNQILVEFRYQDGIVHPRGSTASQGWEDRAILTIAFSNTSK